ncbi:type IV secretory system conjugative DNA transfer family protein [Nitrospirillum bahiense]|uniref:TraM-binding TraD/TraG-like protein n=1 Tax=Nitrospirillum amazonense TaxID=28077 RepID=A0A560FHN7_9PROT|nr:TraM recognition domain-containing protein [Nitrospirillum amazonense]TWB21114.1 TraM-binding TraD/TraG-like protein [Nitrospirillum amazonense]
MGLREFYVGYLWQDARRLDALVLHPPLAAPDDDATFARELYHRHLAHLMATRLWQTEWQALLAAGVAALLLHWLSKPTLPGLPLFAFCLLLVIVLAGGARYLVGWLFGTSKAEHEAAMALTSRVCLRPHLTSTPSDLADPWRHGWLLADGRPVASEIAETDLRSTDAAQRAGAWLWLALVIGLLPLATTLLAFVPLAALLILALVKSKLDPNPAAVRARLLDVAAAHSAEAAAWSTGGASKWARQAEAAREAQIEEAIRDTSPILNIGSALGILAARGDALAPSKGLPMVLSLKDLMQHVIVFGGTGSGKTAGVLRPLCKQIAALSGVGLIVMDGKGSLPGEVAAMIPGFTVIDPASTAISLVEGLTPTEIASTIRDILASKDAKDKFFDDSAMALLRFAAVLAQLDDEAGFSLASIWQIARDGAPSHLLDKVNPSIPEQDEAATFFTSEWPALEAKTRASILATLRTWYMTITGHPATLQWAMTAAGGSDADIKSALTGGRVGILAPAHRYGAAGRVVMALIKARLYAAIRDRADKGLTEGETPVVLIMDEAQEIAMKEDADILGIARSLQLAVVAATQTVEGVEAQLGEFDAAKWLTLFGSVIALQNRSPKTAALVASRIGATYRPTLDSIPGVPTLRGAVWAQQATGRIAAAKNQPLLASTIELGQGGRVADLLSAINPFQLFKANLAGQQDRPTSKIAVAPIVTAEEVNELVVEPNTALAVLTRARVPRRDVVRLSLT